MHGRLPEGCGCGPCKCKSCRVELCTAAQVKNIYRVIQGPTFATPLKHQRKEPGRVAGKRHMKRS